MSILRKWIISIPWGVLVVFSIWMLIAPISPEPHFWQKLGWLQSGHPFTPLDVFDVFWHLLPTVLLIIKAVVLAKNTAK